VNTAEEASTVSATFTDNPPDIFPSGMLPQELCLAFSLDRPFRGLQIFSWLARGAVSFMDMTDLPVSERDRLTGLVPVLYSSTLEECLQDKDGSVKLRIRLKDGAAVEAVLLADAEGRLTACLSTQVGCPMACGFCKTGSLGYRRNLGADEIVEQFLHLSARSGKPSNIVFMGMGEPLLNLAAVRQAIAIFSHTRGLHISLRKITISTCGLVPGIMDLADNGPHVRLAVSLTTADEALRDRLMPVNRTWNLTALKAALMHYQHITSDRITLETAIMAGLNTSPADARAMAAWIRPLNVQVNVIPWNPVAGLPYREPTSAEIRIFEDELDRLGVNAVRRTRRGRGVGGACGQLGDTSGQ
jgi:23S rRNA (adenine2503-C2)-methyltransferase